MSEPGLVGRYLYAVCRGLDPAALTGLTALDDEPLEVVAYQALQAVVSSVPMAAFGEDELRRNLEDIDWLEDVARRHDAVVRALAGRVPTAPMRLATICYDDDAVRARLRAWHVDLNHVLDRIEGCAEWSVKVLTMPAAPAAEPVAAGSVSGADYLHRKKAEAQARAAQDDSAAEVAGRIHDELARLAKASRRLPAQDPRLSGHQGVMVLNAAYLVPDEAGEEFADLVLRLSTAEPAVVVDGRGPWPPYSFAMLDQR